MRTPLNQVPVPVFLPAPLDSSQPSPAVAEEQKSKTPSDPLDTNLLTMTDLVTEDEGKTEATSINSEPPCVPRASACVCGLACRARQGTFQAHDGAPARQGGEGRTGQNVFHGKRARCTWPGILGAIPSFKQKLA